MRAYALAIVRCARIVAVSLLGTVAFACQDTSAPDSRLTSIAAGRDYEHVAPLQDTAYFDYRAPENSSFLLIVTALTNEVHVVVRDAMGERVLGPGIVTTTNVPGGVAVYPRVYNVSPQKYRIAITGDGRFRIRVEQRVPAFVGTLINIGDTIDRTFEGERDIDVYSARVKAGELLVTYIQALDATGSGRIIVSMNGSSPFGDAATSSKPGDTELEKQATEPWEVHDDSTYTFTVQGDYVGRYRLKTRRIDRRPEAASAELLSSSVLASERLDYVGDRDEFVLHAPPGTIYNFMFRLTNGDPRASAELEVSLTGVFDLRNVLSSSGTETSLTHHATGRLTIGPSGTANLVLRPVGTATGSYELLASRIDPNPEHGTTSIAVGDSITTESIDSLGDIDDFSFDSPVADTLSLFIAGDSTSRWSTSAFLGLRIIVLDQGGNPVAGTSGQLTGFATGPFALEPGHYTVRINSPLDASDGYVGSYQLWLRRVRNAPEGISSTLVFNKVVTESIDPPGDTDNYTLDAVAGEDFRLVLRALAPKDAIELDAGIQRERDGKFFNGAIAGSTDGLTPAGNPSHRIEVTQNERFRIGVYSPNGSARAAERGRYQLVAEPLEKAPEHVPPTVTVGTSIVNEPIDYADDVDEFILVGAPGTEFSIFAPNAVGHSASMYQLMDEATRRVISYGYGGLYPTSLGRWQLPASGRLLLRASGPQEGGFDPALNGSYRVDLRLINRAPENSAALITVGDTIRTEAIDPPGDIDEFRFAGVAGERLVVLFDTPRGASTPGFIAEVLDPTGRVIASATSRDPSLVFGDTRSKEFVIPIGGTYTIRVYDLDDRSTDPFPFWLAVVKP